MSTKQENRLPSRINIETNKHNAAWAEKPQSELKNLFKNIHNNDLELTQMVKEI